MPFVRYDPHPPHF